MNIFANLDEAVSPPLFFHTCGIQRDWKVENTAGFFLHSELLAPFYVVPGLLSKKFIARFSCEFVELTSIFTFICFDLVHWLSISMVTKRVLTDSPTIYYSIPLFERGYLLEHTLDFVFVSTIFCTLFFTSVFYIYRRVFFQLTVFLYVQLSLWTLFMLSVFLFYSVRLAFFFEFFIFRFSGCACLLLFFLISISFMVRQL